MNTTEIIHKEHFEHWLFSQAEERTFDYSDTRGCMGCAFVKETTRLHNPMFGGSKWNLDKDELDVADIPEWLIEVLYVARIVSGDSHFTIADTKRAWLKLFPETEVNIQPAQSVKEVK